MSGGLGGGNHIRVPGESGGGKIEIICPKCQTTDLVDDFHPRDPHLCKRHKPPIPMVLVPKKKSS